MFYFLNSNIRYLRKKAGYTIPAFAKLIGVGKSTIDNIECGVNKTSLEVLNKIHDVFKVSLDDLIFKDLSKQTTLNFISFKEKLKLLRINNNLTQQQMSELLNITRQAYAKYEQGKREPNFDTLKKIVKILNCSYNDLLA